MAALIRFFSSLFSFGRGLFAFLLFLTLSYALLHTSLQNKAAIVQVAVSTVLYPAQLVVNKVTHWKHLEYDNKVLREINGRLRIENDLLRQNFLRELRLQNLQNRGMEFGDSLLLAEVVARNPGRLQTSLLISLGPQDEDIQRGMPVFTSRGLVGKVSKVFQGHALVQLMTDPLSKVSVLADRTRITGILESPDSRMLYVEFPAHASLQIGDTLVTSGLGGVFPKGMRVGMIRKLLPGEIDVMQKAEVLPFQNPAEVEEVFVLKKEVDWVVRGFVE